MENLKKMKTICIKSTTVIPIIAVYFLTINAFAQSVGGLDGTKYDIFEINNDNSNHFGQLRLQTTANSAFTLSNYFNRLGISYEASNVAGNGPGLEIFAIDTNGNTAMNNALVGNVGYGQSWAGFTHKSQVSKTGYSFLASASGATTLINKEDTGNGFIGFRVGNVDKVVITNNGNVGIGTTAPTEKLEVVGNILASGNVASNGDIQANNAVIKGNIEADQVTSNQVEADLVTSNQMEATQINIGLSQLSSATENENTLLTVTGGVKTDKVVLNIGSFPDYVFENDYKLMPISEVANYIAKNKHLPNIPAEKEMIASGMDMQMISLKLVEKIEELTLYTIQQEEKLETQNQLIKELINRLNAIEGKK